MNEEMRKEFEEWNMKSNATRVTPNFIMKDETSEYIDPQTTALWEAWQASREAMKPIKISQSTLMLLKSIQQAGYKVEE